MWRHKDAHTDKFFFFFSYHFPQDLDALTVYCQSSIIGVIDSFTYPKKSRTPFNSTSKAIKWQTYRNFFFNQYTLLSVCNYDITPVYFKFTCISKCDDFN